ncbi:hypothetical protein B566_EDAN014110 [Ephemera danica]|nr:hypothetical protein B566_EDAN014110 [Ephemera danica]
MDRITKETHHYNKRVKKEMQKQSTLYWNIWNNQVFLTTVKITLLFIRSSYLTAALLLNVTKMLLPHEMTITEITSIDFYYLATAYFDHKGDGVTALVLTLALSRAGRGTGRTPPSRVVDGGLCSHTPGDLKVSPIHSSLQEWVEHLQLAPAAAFGKFETSSVKIWWLVSSVSRALFFIAVYAILPSTAAVLDAQDLLLRQDSAAVEQRTEAVHPFFAYMVAVPWGHTVDEERGGASGACSRGPAISSPFLGGRTL